MPGTSVSTCFCQAVGLLLPSAPRRRHISCLFCARIYGLCCALRCLLCCPLGALQGMMQSSTCCPAGLTGASATSHSL